jgi:hypothetical protein
MANETADPIRQDRIEDVFSDLDGSVLVTTSTFEDLAGLVRALESGTDAEVQVLTDEPTAKTARDSFLLASRMVDLIDGSVLDLRVATPRSPFSTLLIGTDDVRAVASISGGAITELRADADDSTIESARTAFEDLWADAEAFAPRTPAYSTMLETLEERLGSGMREDVEDVFESGTAGGADEGTIRPVRLSLLMGAKNEVQFYELGLWGESEGVASRAKFSREKQALEEGGLVDTEKIPTDVGRPRQRLVLPDDVDGSDPEELAETARNALLD